MHTTSTMRPSPRLSTDPQTHMATPPQPHPTTHLQPLAPIVVHVERNGVDKPLWDDRAPHQRRLHALLQGGAEGSREQEQG